MTALFKKPNEIVNIDLAQRNDLTKDKTTASKITLARPSYTPSVTN